MAAREARRLESPWCAENAECRSSVGVITSATQRLVAARLLLCLPSAFIYLQSALTAGSRRPPCLSPPTRTPTPIPLLRWPGQVLATNAMIPSSAIVRRRYTTESGRNAHRLLLLMLLLRSMMILANVVSRRWVYLISVSLWLELRLLGLWSLGEWPL